MIDGDEEIEIKKIMNKEREKVVRVGRLQRGGLTGRARARPRALEGSDLTITAVSALSS